MYVDSRNFEIWCKATSDCKLIIFGFFNAFSWTQTKFNQYILIYRESQKRLDEKRRLSDTF